MNQTVYNRNANMRMGMDTREARMEQGQDGCGGCSDLDGRALAMAYVPMQKLCDLYEPCAALIAGTLFRELDKPFCGNTISASAYPSAPARTCDCQNHSSDNMRRCCGNTYHMMRGGARHG